MEHAAMSRVICMDRFPTIVSLTYASVNEKFSYKIYRTVIKERGKIDGNDYARLIGP